jgi:hypothetical protein
MNDEKYIHYTERIQNLLVKPQILKLMRLRTDDNNSNTEQADHLTVDQLN